jgi:glycosyltransferase involved in cell wall biosynthesis
MPASGRAPLAVVVLTRDEERNLPACLASVSGWVQAIYVVDSGSTDRTVAIAARCGATVATNRFESHARQWNWALRELPITAPWVLALDADQRVTPELADDIRAVLDRDARSGALADLGGFYVRRRQIFRGKWIKHGGYYPRHLLKLFRAGHGWAEETDLVDHHFRVQGRVGMLAHDLIEDNRNEADICVWIAKHTRYAARQAEEESGRNRNGSHPIRWRDPHARARRLKRQVWSALPLYVRPALYFFYRYVLRLGFLDGKEGFVFHFLQAYWYRLLVDIKLDELRRATRRGRAATGELEAC